MAGFAFGAGLSLGLSLVARLLFCAGLSLGFGFPACFGFAAGLVLRFGGGLGLCLRFGLCFHLGLGLFAGLLLGKRLGFGVSLGAGGCFCRRARRFAINLRLGIDQPQRAFPRARTAGPRLGGQVGCTPPLASGLFRSAKNTTINPVSISGIVSHWPIDSPVWAAKSASCASG